MGADRVMSRGEIEKLALYAPARPTIDVADIEAIVGDASELAIDRTLNAAASGDAARAVAEFARAVAAGESAQMIISPCSAPCSGCTASAPISTPAPRSRTSIRQQRPPVHFKQKDAIGLQCRMWSSPRLAQALARAAEAAKAARLTSSARGGDYRGAADRAGRRRPGRRPGAPD